MGKRNISQYGECKKDVTVQIKACGLNEDNTVGSYKLIEVFITRFILKVVNFKVLSGWETR